MRSDIVSRVRFHIIEANFKIKRILDEINPYVLMWSSDQKPCYSTSIIKDRYNPYWDETYEFTLIRGDKEVKLTIRSEKLYPKSISLIDTIKIPVGQIGDHVAYDGPIYKEGEEVGTFSYEIDFLPIEYSQEIEDKYRKEMEEKQKEEERKEEEQKRKEEEQKRKEEEQKRKEEEEKRKKEEPQRKMVAMPYRRIIRPRKGQDERDWEWAKKYYET